MKLVVWFPGLGSFANVTGTILDFFENDPDTDVMRMSYSQFGTSGPSAYTKALDPILSKIEPHYDLVYYIGHSMGGSVAAKLITDYHHKPAKLVTIGTPQKKLPLLNRLGFLTELGIDPIWPKDVPTLHIAGGIDFLAGPPTQKRLKRFGFHEHTSILFSPKAAAEIYSFCTYKD